MASAAAPAVTDAELHTDVKIIGRAYALQAAQFDSLNFLLSSFSLRFAGGEGAQRRSGRRIFGTRPKGRTARTGRSVAHTLRCLYQRRRLKRRVSEGGAARYKHDHAPGAEELDRPKR